MSYCPPGKASLFFLFNFYHEKRREHPHLDIQENFVHIRPFCFYMRSYNASSLQNHLMFGVRGVTADKRDEIVGGIQLSFRRKQG